MTVSLVTPLPPAPNRATMPEGTFDDVADTFVAGMEGLPLDFNQSITEFNADAAVVNAKAAQVASDAIETSADRAATEDVYEALVNGNLPQAVGTSVSAVTIGVGAKAFAASTGKTWFTGMAIIARSAASASNYIVGEVASYDPATGALTILSLVTAGTGSHSNWLIYPAGYRYRQRWAEIASQPVAGQNAITFAGIPEIYSDLSLEFAGVETPSSTMVRLQFSPDGVLFSGYLPITTGTSTSARTLYGNTLVFNYRAAASSVLAHVAHLPSDNEASGTTASTAGGAIRMSAGISAIRVALTNGDSPPSLTGAFGAGSIKLLGR
jgi:hypothetical protein